jgi:hypothetical protein
VKLFILAGCASLACVVATAGCGSSSNKGSFSGEDGGAEGGEGGASSGGEGGTGEGGSSGGATPYVGTVSAAKTNAATPVYGLTAEFAATPDAAAGTPTCAGTQSGSCCYIAPGALASDAGAPTVTLVSAGAISFTDGTTALANISPGTNNGYAIGSGNNPSVKWTAGDTLKVAAAGGAVNAFTANLVTAADLEGVTPTLSTTATTVPITADLTVSWTASTATSMEVLIDAIKTNKGDGTITCLVADSAGTVSVPSALLGKLTTGDTGLISLTRTNLTKSTDGNVTVNLTSTVTAAGAVKFQ